VKIGRLKDKFGPRGERGKLDRKMTEPGKGGWRRRNILERKKTKRPAPRVPPTGTVRRSVNDERLKKGGGGVCRGEINLSIRSGALDFWITTVGGWVCRCRGESSLDDSSGKTKGGGSTGEEVSLIMIRNSKV